MIIQKLTKKIFLETLKNKSVSKEHKMILAWLYYQELQKQKIYVKEKNVRDAK